MGGARSFLAQVTGTFTTPGSRYSLLHSTREETEVSCNPAAKPILGELRPERSRKQLRCQRVSFNDLQGQSQVANPKRAHLTTARVRSKDGDFLSLMSPPAFRPLRLLSFL